MAKVHSAVLLCLFAIPVALLAGVALAQSTPAWEQQTKEALEAYRTGDYARAARRFTDAVEIAEKFGPDDERLAGSLNNLAVVLTKRGKYVDAERLFSRALAIVDKRYGPGDLKSADLRSNLALLYDTEGTPLQGEPVRNQALGIYNKLKGEDAVDVADRLYCIAIAFHNRDKDNLAEAVLKDVESVYRKVFGPESASLASCLQAEAVALVKQGKIAQAVPLLQQASSIYEKEGDSCRTFRLMTLSDLGVAYEKDGRFAEAEPVLKQAADMEESIMSSGEPAPVHGLTDAAILCQASSDQTKMIPAFRLTAAAPPNFTGLADKEQFLGLSAYHRVLKALNKKEDARLAEKRMRQLSQQTNPYMASIERLVRKRWKPPAGTQSYRTVIFFRVLPDGHTSHTQIMKSSAASRYDVAALDAVERAQPFPPPPAGIKSGAEVAFTLYYYVAR